MSGHTPGPWVTVNHNGFAVFIEHTDSSRIVHGVATVFGSGTIRDEFVIANANLIAAAPDLLEALESLMRVVAKPDCAESLALGSARAKATAAIARAKGEA